MYIYKLWNHHADCLFAANRIPCVAVFTSCKDSDKGKILAKAGLQAMIDRLVEDKNCVFFVDNVSSGHLFGSNGRSLDEKQQVKLLSLLKRCLTLGEAFLHQLPPKSVSASTASSSSSSHNPQLATPSFPDHQNASVSAESQSPPPYPVSSTTPRENDPSAPWASEQPNTQRRSSRNSDGAQTNQQTLGKDITSNQETSTSGKERSDADKQVRRQEEEGRRLEAENAAMERAKRKEEEAAQREAEQLQREIEEKDRRESEEKARLDAEERARIASEERARQEATELESVRMFSSMGLASSSSSRHTR